MNPVLPDQEQDIVADLNTLGPGDRLRNARLALDIDIAKLANRLHLTTDVIEALERDDYSEMTARVFVRGYLRNYAREVNLPVDSVLEQFDQIWPESERPMKITTPPRLAADSHPGNRWSTIFTWLVVLSGIALFLIWWQGYLDDFIEQQRPASEQVSDTSQAPAIQENVTALPAFMQLAPQPTEATSAPSAPTVANQATDNQASITTPTAGTQAETSSVVDSQSATEPNAQSAATLTPTEPDVSATTSSEGVREITIDESGQVDTSTQQNSATEQVVMELRPVERPVESTPVASQSEPAPEPVAIDPKAVSVSFVGRCWVDIRDSTRNFKLVGEMNQGDTHQLKGTAPYTMIIGNANAAKIQVGGKPYDLAPHTNGNVARLTLRP